MNDSLMRRVFARGNVQLIEFDARNERLIVRLKASTTVAECVECASPSSRVHGKYWRRIEDLPRADKRVTLELLIRRFRCANPDCRRTTFSEGLPSVVGRSQRMSQRLHRTLWHIGLALGGEAGARLARQLNISVSRQSILWHLRRNDRQIAPQENLRVIGIDDFAFKRGHRYGTIVVDQITRRPVEVFADRDSKTVATWLRSHPTIQVVTRDRAGVYADGIRSGAPGALHVADRWHLLKNLGDVIERVVARCQRDIRQIARALPVNVVEASIGVPPSSAALNDSVSPAEQLKQNRRAKRLDRYEQVLEHYQRCLSIRATARALGVDRRTVSVWLRAAQFPERAPRAPRPTLLDDYREHLVARWEQGCSNAKALYREIAALGYRGSDSTVRVAVKAWRRERGIAPPKPRSLPAPSTRRVCCWIQGHHYEESAPYDRCYIDRFIDALCQTNEDLPTTRELSRAFADMFKQKRPKRLSQWIRRAVGTGVASSDASLTAWTAITTR